MSVLVFVESSDNKIKKTSREAVAYGAAINPEVTAIYLGTEIEQSELESLGSVGAKKVLHLNDERLDKGAISAYSKVISDAMNSQGCKILVLADSSLGTPVAARTAVKLNASLASNVTELPDTSEGFKVKRGIYTGKAFAITELPNEFKILTIKKNAVQLEESSNTAVVESMETDLADSDFKTTITGIDKATGDVLLPEAEIVVSGGRGMKGPENWGMLEELAKELGAATACSKPVSDMEWRPHHEHVGQTGVKVAPNLYIAVGISGAIQHLAGVNSSKVIVVINKDAEAPFFKAADYGIVGDAFEVIPKLTEAIRASK